jgi:multiple antibiotic resistance protein
MKQDLSYIFVIFMLTLGPIKTIPKFFALTRQATPAFRQKVAIQSALIALGVCLFIAFIGVNVLGKWQVSLDALRLSGGLILLLSALKVVTVQSSDMVSGKEKVTTETPLSETLALAFSPLTTPIIVTPYGVVAILFFMSIAKENTAFKVQIIGVIFLMMVLNYLGMLFADKIMKTLGFPVLRLIGWIFAVMQSALAIDVMLGAFKSLGLIQKIS